MDEILKGIGDGISQILNDPTIQTAFRATAIYIGAIWLVTAYWAYRDLRTRTTNPLLPYGAAAAIILFTPIFFPLGVVLYRIMRPPETVAEASERALAEEAMLVEVEKQHHCAACKRAVGDDWVVCPYCRTRLRRICSSCGRLVETDWSICAFCGKDFDLPEYTREQIRRVPAGRPAQAALPAPARAAAVPLRRLPGEAPEPRTATRGT